MKKNPGIFFALGFLGFLFLNAQPSAAFFPWKGPYLVIANDDNNKWSPSVAYASKHDEYLVVWEVVEIGGHHSIYGRRVGPSGPMSDEFLIYSGSYNSLQPAVAYDVTHDRYLVVWAYDSAGDGTDGDIYGRFIPWNGPIPGEAAFGIDVARTNLDKPKLAYSPTSDEFLVVWRVLPALDNLYAIAGGIIYYDKTGKPIDISSGLEARDFPDVTYNLVRNEFVVVWDVDVGRDEQDLDIYAMRLDFSGAPMPPGEFAVATSISNEQHPTVAACHQADKYLIAWQQQVNRDYNENIFARLMTGTGVLDQSYGVAGTTLPQRYPRLACNLGGGEFFLTWQDQYAQPLYRWGVWAEVVHTDLIIEPAFEVVRPSDTRDRLYPAVAYGDKNALVVWQHARDNSGYLDIWGVFLAQIPPSAFNKISPANGATNQSISTTLTWESSTGSDSYEYCYDTSNNNACDGNWTSVDRNTTSAALSGLSPGTTYYWQVRSNNSLGTTYAQGSSAAFWSFTTVPNPPAAFNKISPANGATNQSTSPTLTWGSSTGATSYEYCIDATNDNACTTWVSNGSSISVSLSELANNSSYYWQVRAKNAGGTTYAQGSSTAYWSFTTTSNPPPAAFNKTSPANGTSNQSTSPELTWSASGGANSYEYCYDTTNDNNCDGSWVSAGNKLSVNLNGLSVGTAYYWQVRARNDNGVTNANGGSWWEFITSQSIPNLRYLYLPVILR